MSCNVVKSNNKMTMSNFNLITAGSSKINTVYLLPKAILSGNRMIKDPREKLHIIPISKKI